MLLSLTISEWIDSIATIAALITAVITFFTVVEVRRQRENSYHPEVNIANFQFYVYRYDKELDADDDNIYLYYSKSKLLSSTSIQGYNELAIEINNIGLGVAKRLFWSWEVDIYELCRSLECEDEKLVRWIIDSGDLNVIIDRLNIHWIYPLGEVNEGGYFNFILPYSIENRKNEIVLPSYFLDLFWIYKIKSFLCRVDNEMKEYPPIKLHLSYTDMHGKEIYKTFLIHLGYNFIASPFVEQSELGLFRVVVLEVV